MTLKPTATPRQHSRRRGDSLVEFALIVPVLVLIVMAVFDFGRAVYAYSVVANSAREGARFGIISTATPNDIITVVQNSAVGLDPAQLAVSVTYPTTDTVRVVVSYTLELTTPLVAEVVSADGSVVLGSSATMYTGY